MRPTSWTAPWWTRPLPIRTAPASSHRQVRGPRATPRPPTSASSGTDDGCTVGATLVRSQANSTAGGGLAFSNPTGTQLVGLVVAGTPINVTPQPNTVIELPGIGFVILNEQLCDGTAALPNCSGTTSSGLTVRSIRVVITAADALIEGLGVEVIVAEAHADSFAAL